jgi:hypothetical protein
LLLSLREQQDLYMAAANKKGVLKLQRAFKDKQLIAILPDQYPGIKVVGLCSDTTRAVISQQPKCGTNKIVFSSP